MRFAKSASGCDGACVGDKSQGNSTREAGGERDRGSCKLAMAVAMDKNRRAAAVDAQEGFLVRIECRGPEVQAEAGGRVGASCGWRVVDSAFDRGSRAGRSRRPERRTAAALLNLWRVEQGHPVSDWLVRLFWLAKKSVSRNFWDPCEEPRR